MEHLMATKSEKSFTFIYDAETDEFIEREMNTEELENQKLILDESIAEKAFYENQKNNRASALAKLADLGLTAEEIAAL